MCRNAGLGLGNFLAGILLNMFAMEGYTEVVSVNSQRMRLEYQAAYEPTGYYAAGIRGTLFRAFFEMLQALPRHLKA